MYGNSMHTKSLSKNVSENISNVFSGFERLLSCKQNALFDLIWFFESVTQCHKCYRWSKLNSSSMTTVSLPLPLFLSLPPSCHCWVIYSCSKSPPQIRSRLLPKAQDEEMGSDTHTHGHLQYAGINSPLVYCVTKKIINELKKTKKQYNELQTNALQWDEPTPPAPTRTATSHVTYAIKHWHIYPITFSAD